MKISPDLTQMRHASGGEGRQEDGGRGQEAGAGGGGGGISI